MIKSSLGMMLAGFVAENPEGPTFFVMVGRIKCLIFRFEFDFTFRVVSVSINLFPLSYKDNSAVKTCEFPTFVPSLIIHQTFLLDSFI